MPCHWVAEDLCSACASAPLVTRSVESVSAYLLEAIEREWSVQAIPHPDVEPGLVSYFRIGRATLGVLWEPRIRLVSAGVDGGAAIDAADEDELAGLQKSLAEGHPRAFRVLIERLEAAVQGAVFLPSMADERRRNHDSVPTKAL
jgi:hypothetical protein